MAGQLKVRKLADKSGEERLVRFHPVTGDKYLVTPAQLQEPDFDYEAIRNEPWPFAGLKVEELPKACLVSTGFVTLGVEEGWLEIEDEQVVHRPGGPPHDLWRITHTFKQGSHLVLHTVDGDVRYRIVYQPDKYVDTRDSEVVKGALVAPENGPGPDDALEVTDEHYAAGRTRVDWVYGLELVKEK